MTNDGFPGLSDAGIPPSMQITLRASRFARRLIDSRPALADEIAFAPHAGWTRETMTTWLEAAELRDPTQLAPAMRQLRSRVMLRLLARDLAGIAPLQEVHETMSALADLTVNAALRQATRDLEADHGVPRAGGVRQGLMVIGMGKLGGRELNVSSDIDLIFVYGAEGETDGERPIDNAAFFQRVGQRIIAALDELTADGRVFRVDMRLRPWGDGGPLATALDALEGYFITHGREWERYAWLKARVIAADPAAPVDELDVQVRHFVFRRYLDFDAIGALRKLHAQIRAEVRRRDLAEHVKLGPGGIREIEFIAQAHQLVRGGRDRGLQVRPTIQAIEALVARGILGRDAALELLAAYGFLRRLEHRLQYLDDAQTHSLPADGKDRALIAAAMGFVHEGGDGAGDVAAFEQALSRHRDAVERQFAATLGAPAAEASPAIETESRLADLWSGALDEDAGTGLLETLGYHETGEALRRVTALRSGSRYRTVPALSQARIDALIPRLLTACGRTPDATATLGRMLTLIETVAGRSAYLALLTERPGLLQRVAELMAASSWAADYLTRHPALLDEVILPQDDPAPDIGQFVRELRAALAPLSEDTERAMDVMREMHHAQVFRLLVRDLAGEIVLEHLSDHLSALADAVVEASLEACWQRMGQPLGRTPRFAVIAYGKLGGKELGYASDLDLAFVHDDPHPRAPELYARLAQRLLSWLSSRTAAGILFETDLRLRPNGEAGLLVTTLDAFRTYQREHAWSWEHQALTRARACAGDPALGRAFESARLEVLERQREPAPLAQAVRDMRLRMDQAHPNRSGLFDLKHGRGGMIDIEFVVQYLVLAHAAAHAALRANAGNIALLHESARIGLVDPAIASAAADAYRSLRRRQHAMRLNGAEFARVPFEMVATEAIAARALWSAVLGER